MTAYIKSFISELKIQFVQNIVKKVTYICVLVAIKFIDSIWYIDLREYKFKILRLVKHILEIAQIMSWHSNYLQSLLQDLFCIIN